MSKHTWAGQIEVDEDRGVIYFHFGIAGAVAHDTPTPIRISKLPTGKGAIKFPLDLTYGDGPIVRGIVTSNEQGAKFNGD